MVSSLELGPNTFAGPRANPHGAPAPYLTATLADVPLAGPDLGALLRANGGGVQHAQMPAPANIGQFDIQHISDGRFTAQTIENMHKGVLSAKTDAKWRAEMEDIRREGRKSGAIGWKDYLGELRWFDHWFRNVRPIDYVRDGHQIEMVVHPWLTYYKGLGDCDDSSTLMAAAAGVLGAPHRFKTWKADRSRPRDWSHVTTQINVPGHGWMGEDLTVRGAHAGWEPPINFETKIWPEPRWR